MVRLASTSSLQSLAVAASSVAQADTGLLLGALAGLLLSAWRYLCALLSGIRSRARMCTGGLTRVAHSALSEVVGGVARKVACLLSEVLCPQVNIRVDPEFIL